ncbi:hypothetical protein UFOVP661_6 [uncultured Caudovirales phage]|uniref:Uncharacterized protein n=1 Tax=uncultured Caudovirales phage TaxID=2100421 RepID=A0A6J5N9G3_9CAUD|nr:hypothetical protein UFOVP661_6 [uncultured Caudovirales phage]
MASLDDILTAQKNGVVAINGNSTALLRAQGGYTSATVTTDTLVASGRGYLVSWTVVVGGSAAGSVYNSNSTSSLLAGQKLCPIGTTAGVFPAGLVFTNGIVVSPGTGQSINVTYSLG